MQSERALILIIISLSLASIPSQALKVFPTMTELGERFEGEQNYILTILNDGPRTDDIVLTVNYESFYLEPYVKIEPSRFTLQPNSKKNIQITTDFPKNLSPEKHLLIIEPMTEYGPGEKTTYSFKVPGIPRPELKIAGVKVNNKKDSIIIDIELYNTGNVIARSTPIVQIYNSTNQIGKVEYESRIIILPYTKYNLSLLYDARDLPPGAYKAKLQFRYNDNALTNLIEEEFEVTNRDEGSSGALLAMILRYKFPLLAILVLFLLIFSFRPEYLRKIMHGELRSSIPKEYRKRLESADLKMKRLEKETHILVAETQGFIKESNEWFDQRFGKGTFEFK